ncbi:uncharacterized [Tachysurus ichikawai]
MNLSNRNVANGLNTLARRLETTKPVHQNAEDVCIITCTLSERLSRIQSWDLWGWGGDDLRPHLASRLFAYSGSVSQCSTSPTSIPGTLVALTAGRASEWDAPGFLITLCTGAALALHCHMLRQVMVGWRQLLGSRDKNATDSSVIKERLLMFCKHRV